MATIRLRGWPAVVVWVVLTVFAFLVAMGDVLDFYDAWWKFTVPLTLVYAAALWVFVVPLLTKGKEPLPKSTWPLGLDVILANLVITVSLLVATLLAVALIWDLIRLVGIHWHYIVITLVLLAVIIVWAMLMPEEKKGKGKRAKRRADEVVGGTKDTRGSNDIVS